MQCINATSSYVSSVFCLEKDEPCTDRIRQLALPVFAMLAAFVFLPFKAAIVFSAIVLVGSLTCYKNDSGDKDDIPPLVEIRSEEKKSPSQLAKDEQLKRTIDDIVLAQQQNPAKVDNEVIVIASGNYRMPGYESFVLPPVDPVREELEKSFGSCVHSPRAVFPQDEDSNCRVS